MPLKVLVKRDDHLKFTISRIQNPKGLHYVYVSFGIWELLTCIYSKNLIHKLATGCD